MSLPIEEYIETLKRLAPTIPPATLIAIENDLEAKEEEKKQDAGSAGPKAKNEFITVLLDPENKLAGLGDFTSLVLQIPEGQDAGDTLPRLYAAVYDQRAAAKRKTKPLANLVEAAANLKRKFAKERSITIKTKEPVRVLVTDGQIPVA